MDGQRRPEEKKEIINHIQHYFASLYSNEGWERPSLDNIGFDVIGAPSQPNGWKGSLKRKKLDRRSSISQGIRHQVWMGFRWPSFNVFVE